MENLLSLLKIKNFFQIWIIFQNDKLYWSITLQKGENISNNECHRSQYLMKGHFTNENFAKIGTANKHKKREKKCAQLS